MRKKIVKYQFSSQIKKDIKSLTTLDNWHCWIALFEDIAVITFAVFISLYVSWFLLPVSILLIGSRQRALATILHESSHGAFAKNKKLNHIMGTFFSGYLIFQTMATYKKSHVNNHHAKFGNPDQDPDYKYALENKLYAEGALTKSFKDNFISPLFLSKVPSYFKALLRDRLTEGRNKKEISMLLGYWAFIIGIFIYFDIFSYLLLFWVIPYITTFNIIGWYIELSEHYPLMQGDNTLFMTRNRFSHPIEHFLTGMHNENFHLIHHLFPTVPFWKLPKAHEILMQDQNYRKHNEEIGGILLSKDQRPSLFSYLKLKRKQALSQSKAVLQG